MELERQVEEILTNYDFERVHKVMKLLNWEWGTGKTAAVPDINQIKRFAVDLMRKAFRVWEDCQETTWIGSGGFWVICDGRLQLLFSVASWDSYE